MISATANPLVALSQLSQRSIQPADPAAAADPNAPAEELTEEQRAAQKLQEAAAGENNSESPFDGELTEEEQKIVDELKETDAKVRAHEQAHKSVAGGYAGAIQYETVTGPDGQQYAVAGEVPIDTSPIPDNPQATIQKMDIVIRAALAPADPSPQDFAVARAAQQARAQAQRELQEERRIEQEEAGNTAPNLNEIEAFDPNASTAEQQQQISKLIQGLNDTEQLTEQARGNLFNAIN